MSNDAIGQIIRRRPQQAIRNLSVEELPGGFVVQTNNCGDDDDYRHYREVVPNPDALVAAVIRWTKGVNERASHD